MDEHGCEEKWEQSKGVDGPVVSYDPIRVVPFSCVDEPCAHGPC